MGDTVTHYGQTDQGWYSDPDYDRTGNAQRKPERDGDRENDERADREESEADNGE